MRTPTTSTSLLERFQGSEGQRRVAEALRSQRIANGSEAIAEELRAVASIERFEPEQALIVQDDASNDIFLVLGGRVSIQINGREVNQRGPNLHVGEMTAIDVGARRSATVTALEETVAARITEPEFARIANDHPEIWRVLACELGERLRQRSSGVRQRNDMPRVFIGSSSEALGVARAIQIGLDYYDQCEVTVWTDGVFRASRTNIENLEREAHTTDFAVLVVTPDDVIESRGEQSHSPRDNVVFELGLFMGAVGRERTIIVRPRGSDIRIPSDLLGVTPLTYSLEGGRALDAAVASVCEALRRKIESLGSI